MHRIATRLAVTGGLISLAVFCMSVGCSSESDGRKPTYPVIGEVLVDGQPAADLEVMLHPVSGMDTISPTVSQAMTGQDGRFKVSTYVEGDGAPEGEYRVTFAWGKLNTISMSYDGDRLGGKYRDPAKSEFIIRVEPDKTVDMGKIELKSS